MFYAGFYAYQKIWWRISREAYLGMYDQFQCGYVTGSCLAQWVVIPFAVLTPMIVAAGVEIWINSPIDSENRRLTLEEKRDCRQMVRWLSVVAFTAYVMLRYAHQDILASAVGLALVLAASTQVLAGIQQMREKR